MKVKDKIYMSEQELAENGPINIVVFGDSITHGGFLDEIDFEPVYWNLLRKKIIDIRCYVPVNIINAGVSSITAKASLKRMENQVLSHCADLIIVCFGLNDINGTLDEYLSSLRIIFDKCIKSGAYVIFMTPNMLNTYVAEDTLDKYKEYAAVTAEYQNSGRMDLYINSAIELAKEMNVAVCDCYSEWKRISQTQDVTQLLINRINHPIPQMHELFANNLFNIIFDN